MISSSRVSALGSADTFVVSKRARAEPSTYELLLALRRRGIEVRPSHEGLRMAGSLFALNDEDRDLLCRRREEIMRFLSAVPDLARPARAEVGGPLAAEGARERAPLTHAQRRLWLLSRLTPEATTYSLPYAFRLRGKVRSEQVVAALHQLIARHDALRSRIEEVEGEPFLRVHPARELEVAELDLRAKPERAAELLQHEASRPFELAGGPLFRSAVYRTHEEELILFFNVHHIVADGWSIEVVVDELTALIDGQSLPKAPPVRFVDCAEYEYRQSEASDLTAALACARRRLSGSAPLELPLDRSRPLVARYRGRTHRFELDRGLVSELASATQAHGVTRYMLLLGAFEVLLSRYSGQTDLVVGSPMAARQHDASERVVGFFANTIVQRIDLSGAPSFRELLERVKESCLIAFEEQDLPFDRIVEAVNPPRDRSRTPLFQAMFTLQETRPREHAITGVELERLPMDSGGTKTDLTLLIEHDGERAFASLEYDRDLFEPETIVRMGKHYQTLLSAALREPERQITELPLLEEQERAELMARNATERPLPAVLGFHELIARRAAAAPERIAVEDHAGTLTYGELQQRADHWTRCLRARGIARGMRVGVSLERNRAMLPVLLGVLQSGAAYVPLDPAFPSERLDYMIQDAELALIISERALVERLPTSPSPLLLIDDEGSHETQGGLADAPLERSDPSDIAYVIYTSGSTGKPKGVQVPHRAVVNLLTSLAEEPGCGPEDRVVALTTLSFDIAVLELFLPLTVGGRSLIAPRSAARDGDELARFIERHGATLVQATPATWRLLLASGLPTRIKRAVSGGEPFPAELARELLPRCDEVWNGYGPTETTVYSTFFRVRDAEQPILIGRPIANTQVYVLDGHLTPVPMGVAGELYIGGVGVSEGYLSKPELTDERFVPDPFAGRGARMYRTGDLVRVRPEGLQFLGRADDQIKLRGYRIELGEIEAVLSLDPAVAQCAVAVREFGPDDKRLVAYVVPEATRQLDEASLLESARAQLPDYMVPRHVMPLTALPLTPSRKVDRKALPKPVIDELASSEPASPVNATERVLLEVWRKVLGSSQIGVTDDFFRVGGHSLLALKLVQEINRTCRTDWTLNLAFEFPTIRSQARAIDGGEHSKGASVVKLADGAHPEALFCVCGINLYQELAQQLAGSRPVYGVFLPVEGELLEGREVELGVAEMAREYVAAIRAKQPHGPYHLAGVSFGGILAYEIAQQLTAAGEQVGVLALLDVVLDGSARRTLTALAQRAFEEVRNGGVRRVLSMALARAQLAVERPLEVCPPQDERELALERRDIEELRHLTYRRAFAAYEPTMAPYAGRALVIRAREELRKLSGFKIARDYGWSRYVQGGIDSYDVPGDHLGILSAAHVGKLAAIINGQLRSFASERGRASHDEHDHPLVAAE